MKNSFFLVIPTQQDNSKLFASYEKEAVIQWVKDLPAANPSLSTRLLYDFIETFNTIKMPTQQRIDVLELLRPSFLLIEENLRSRIMVSGFPKGEDQQKIFNLLVALERNFAIGYWVVIRELTGRDTKWFQGKNIAIAIQRTMKGLSEIIVTHYMMFLTAPDWVWIDLHSLYRLSLKTKKETAKVPDVTCLPSKTNTPENCYKQVLLLSLTDPSGLMQKEVIKTLSGQVFQIKEYLYDKQIFINRVYNPYPPRRYDYDYYDQKIYLPLTTQIETIRGGDVFTQKFSNFFLRCASWMKSTQQALLRNGFIKKLPKIVEGLQF